MCPKRCIIACARYWMCPKKFIITYARYCMCPIKHCAQRSASLHCARYCMCPKKCIIACTRYCMCPKKCIITLCPRLYCAQRNASSHCARDCIVPEVRISPRLHRARSLHVPESNQVISINRCEKQIRSLYSLLISQRRHPSKASSFMACGLHVMA